MSDSTLQDALTMAMDPDELSPFIGTEMVNTAATAYATWMFEQQANVPDDEEAQLLIVQQAISAAYIAGCLDTADLPMMNQAADHTVMGKSGATYNFYFN